MYKYCNYLTLINFFSDSFSSSGESDLDFCSLSLESHLDYYSSFGVSYLGVHYGDGVGGFTNTFEFKVPKLNVVPSSVLNAGA